MCLSHKGSLASAHPSEVSSPASPLLQISIILRAREHSSPTVKRERLRQFGVGDLAGARASRSFAVQGGLMTMWIINIDGGKKRKKY